jgi:hypothetical protein
LLLLRSRSNRWSRRLLLHQRKLLLLLLLLVLLRLLRMLILRHERHMLVMMLLRLLLCHLCLRLLRGRYLMLLRRRLLHAAATILKVCRNNLQPSRKKVEFPDLFFSAKLMWFMCLHLTLLHDQTLLSALYQSI